LRDILKVAYVICNCILAAASLIQGKMLRDILKVAYVSDPCCRCPNSGHKVEGHIESGICNSILAAAALIQGKTLRDILKVAYVTVCSLQPLP
jgi:hypothetical protein